MNKLTKYRVLLSGILSPIAALFLYTFVYATLTRFSADVEKDWLFRLSASTLGLMVPFLITLVLAMKDRRRHTLLLSGKIGLAIAILSLALAWKPVSDGIMRSKQSRNMAMRDVIAPPFDTPDIYGNAHRLADQRGKVVLVSIWANWCGPCRTEMPKLDQYYRERKDQGLILFGLSDEEIGVQKKFLQQVPVTYPLLTPSGEVPAFYRDIVRYPAVFLIDRQGRLQPAPGPDQPFDKLETTVDALLRPGAP